MFSFDGRLLFLTVAGSHAHGTAREGSDLDLRGACVAPLAVRLSLFDALGVPASIVSTLDAERKYRAALKQWESYQVWKSQRNSARAELERRFGYDTQHAMHLVRLMRMGLEALEHGDLSVRRSDAAELCATRAGELSFERLLELAGELERAMQRASEATALPASVDRARADEVSRELMLAEARA